MNISGRSLFRLSLLSALTVLSAAPTLAQQWTPPTPEELSMTSQPQVPGAPAVYLFREETTEDKLHMFSVYVRLKVLTDLGKKYSNVELKYAQFSEGIAFSIDNIQGRTIHPDGAIIPFTGKPYEKLVEKAGGRKLMAKVFTMPDVEAGSIIEYRYKLRFSDEYYVHPDWYIQSDLFTRKAHYNWRPTNRMLSNGRGQLTNSVSWTPILPPDTELKQSRLPPVGGDEGQLIFDLNVHDIPPAPEEDFMPPVSSLSYRVLFYYSPYRTGAEFWKSEGKYWAKERDKFIGPGSAVSAAVRDLVTPSDTQDQKLRKIYAAVMQLENTSFTREHSTAEEKAQGLKEVHNTDDIWTRKRGNNDQIAELFVAMARAAGMKAYLAAVTNRDESIFLPSYLSLTQLDDDIAIVNVDGKEQYFDPGSRYCPYQHLAWKHTMVGGIRQTDGGADFVNAPPESYTYSRTQRVADLTLDQQGAITGNITLTYSGSPALDWRQRSLTGDATSLERDLRTSVEQMMPNGIEVKVASISQLNDYEKPLVAKLEVRGTLGSSTGKRLLLPADIFEANAKPTFPHEKREIPVYFHYAEMNQDAVRIKFPATLKLESLPANDKSSFEKYAIYNVSTESTPTSFTVRRDYFLGEIVFKVDEYAKLRSFYSKIENKDQETVVLTSTPVAAKATPPGN
ncbi:MAG TPA: DUF3857 domain-containing protein [Edaphobacter sp.]|nr:DUF3857 domain-containing protein [Edaphobacter sp.]